MQKKKIVIKVGSLAVTDENGGVNLEKIKNLISDLNFLRSKNFLPILVSSGAINTAKNLIKKPEDKKMSISYQQAKAATGQPLLMYAYIDCLKEYHWTCAQILVTHEDFKDKTRFLNIRNTVNQLLDNNILPIVNENDTVSFAEITVGDNDQLAVMMTEVSEAEKLIILSEADGLYNKNPNEKDAIRFRTVDFKDDFSNVKIASKTSVGRGGMDTKLKAVRKLTPLGIDVILGSFNFELPVSRLIFNSQGTTFLGNTNVEISKQKARLSTLVKNDCYVIIDEGAAKALTTKQTSLLPVGIKKIVGKFKRGDVIQIKHKGKILAIGMTEYESKELDLIKGKHSDELSTVLEFIPSKVAIHKDNLLLK